jgi:hypothetical protein
MSFQFAEDHLTEFVNPEFNSVTNDKGLWENAVDYNKYPAQQALAQADPFRTQLAQLSQLREAAEREKVRVGVMPADVVIGTVVPPQQNDFVDPRESGDEADAKRQRNSEREQQRASQKERSSHWGGI